jgi:hypothetical protein
MFSIFYPKTLPLMSKTSGFSLAEQNKKVGFIWTHCSLKGNGNIFFIFSFERTFKTKKKIILPFFHILLTSTNILIERNEMSAFLDFSRYACYVTTGVTQYFYLDNH